MELLPIPRSFFLRETVLAARELLGATLVIKHPEGLITAMITETEAYVGETDLACHCRSGRTKRTSVMYGQPGVAYVYFTYGHHWMLNVVTGLEGEPAAILIRGIHVTHGNMIVEKNRSGIAESRWTDGPGKLTKACGIDKSTNGSDLTDPANKVWLAKGSFVKNECVTIGPRVGLYTVPEPWKSKPWRFLMKSPYQLEEEWDYLAERMP